MPAAMQGQRSRASASRRARTQQRAQAPQSLVPQTPGQDVGAPAPATHVQAEAPAEPTSPAKKKGLPVSPLAPTSLPDMPLVKGLELGTAACGSRYKNRDDLLVARLAPGTAAAGVFTTSRTAAAPVDWCKNNLAEGAQGRMLVVNAGNANAFTGRAGIASVKATAAAAANLARCRQRDVFIASTGVIGEPLDPSPLITHMDMALSRANSTNWEAAARSIMTTDTFPKLATRTATIGETQVQINGIAKGSGMIAPDMATMLAFVFTDALVAPGVLQTLLLLSVRDSFNAITVDSDTSTNDSVMLFATGAAMDGQEPVKRAGDTKLKDFRIKLDEVLMDLALQVVRDGEGAQKLVKITVSGATSYQAARRIGMTIANSPLVKTAIAGEDANWGRIVAAVGRAGEQADRDKLAIRIGGIAVAASGMRVPDYDETPVAAHMKGQEIDIAVDVGVGRAAATVWTCDLTHGYIDINADYRS